MVVDLLGEREPFYEEAAKIATLADEGRVQIAVSALSYATVYYLLCRYEKALTVEEKLLKFKVIAQTSDLTDRIIDKALLAKFKDFEDAIQYHCALQSNCQILLTRNERDFEKSEIPVMTPNEYLKTRIYRL